MDGVKWKAPTINKLTGVVACILEATQYDLARAESNAS